VTPERPTAAVLAQRIAEHLPGWTFAPNENDGTRYPVLEGAEGMGLCLTVSGPRLMVRGRAPRYTDGRFGNVGSGRAITVDAARAPAAIAREIARRVITGYTADYAEERRAIAEREAQEEAARAFAARLADVLGSVAKEDRPGTSLILIYSEEALSGEFTVNTGDAPTVSVKLRGYGLSAAHAERIAAFLNPGDKGEP
jgi:hypothetical protein